MGHNFYCSRCGRWVANCGFANNKHKERFSFSTTCACGARVSGSCGGRQMPKKVKIFKAEIRSKKVPKIKIEKTKKIKKS
jgi:hypothetical protein